MSEGGKNNDSENDNDTGEPSAMDDSDGVVQGTWETGLRRRRGGGGNPTSSNNGGGNDEPRRGNDGGIRTDGDGRLDGAVRRRGSPPRRMPASGPAGGGGATAPVGDPPRGSGGGAAGVLTAGATADACGGGPPTPFKAPTKEGGGLVPPSSVTTAGETADLTFATETPPDAGRSPRGGDRRGLARQPSAASAALRRQYRLLWTQVLLLLGSASVGLLLFLFYALPLAASASLALLASSLGALVPVARSFVRARYEVEMQHPLGLTRYLPDALRVLLTETTLHDYMTDGTFFLEHRYLLLYFMPGLEPEQVMDFIRRLPPRHQDVLLRPGLGRLMPSVMGHLMRMESNAGGATDADPPLLENGDDASAASGLTADQEHQGGDGEVDEADEVTLLEAVTGLGRTIAGIALGNGANAGDGYAASGEVPSGDPHATMQSPQTSAANTQGNIENSGDQDDDNSSIAFSIDISARGLGDADEAPAAPAAPAADIIVELPLSDEDADNPDGENAEDIQRQEQELEGRILSEAATAAAANYGAQATAAASEAVVSTLATTSLWGIRAGALTGFVAGGGGIVAAVLANQRGAGSLFVNLGILSGSTRSAGAAGSSSGGEGGGDAPPSAQWVRGLFATSAFGFVGAGVAYLIRNHARAVIAENRAKRLEESPDGKDQKDEP